MENALRDVPASWHNVSHNSNRILRLKHIMQKRRIEKSTSDDCDSNDGSFGDNDDKKRPKNIQILRLLSKNIPMLGTNTR